MRIKNSKRVVSSVISGLLMASALNVAANTQYFVNDGKVVVEGNLLEARAGSVITATVIDGKYDWTDEAVWSNDSGTGRGTAENIEFYDVLTAGKNGSYRLAFSPKSNGAYTIYLGCDELNEAKKIDVVYVNETDNTSAINTLASTDISGIENVLKTQRDELGLFATIYDDAMKDQNGYFDAAKVTQIATDLHTELAGITEKNTQNVIELIQGIMLMNMFENGAVDDIDNYKDYLYLSDTDAEIYASRLSTAVTDSLNDASFLNTADFKEKVIESLIVENINDNDGLGVVLGILDTYSQKLGVKSRHDKTALAAALINNDGFLSIGDVKSFISTYPVTGGGNSSSGQSSGRGSGRVTTTDTPRFNGSTAVGALTPVEKAEISVFDDLQDVPWAEEAITALYWKEVINGKSEGIFAPNDYVTREEFAKMITAAFRMNMVDDEFPFVDVTPEDWCYSYVKTAYLAGITNGVSENMFGKGQNIIRQDVCVMLYNAVNSADYELSGDKNIEFSDYNDIADYAIEAVNAAVAAGVINGSNGCFMPNAFATRAEAAKMIYYTITNMKSL